MKLTVTTPSLRRDNLNEKIWDARSRGGKS